MKISGNQSVAADTALIGIDWGTSRVRAYRIDAAGEILEYRDHIGGIAAIRDRGFDHALSTLVIDWQPQRGALPIVMCGMISGREGWREVPYCTCPATLSDLAAAMQPVDTRCGPALIVGGLRMSSDSRGRDVMRGEETQVLGAVAPRTRQLTVAPGTHSKWAMIHDERIETFDTYMTGEVYDLLCKHSTLGWLLEGASEQVEANAEFVSGVRRSFEDPELLHALFSVRVKGVLDASSSNALRAHLSGILIGNEVLGATARHNADSALIIATPHLARLYACALHEVGAQNIQQIDASPAVARGLWRLWRAFGELPC
jgi:2-dehydro-3-deoxygalactonokinase